MRSLPYSGRRSLATPTQRDLRADAMSDDVKFVEANGLRFGYLESGQGPLVLLVHGFPDTAHSWDATRAALAAAGYRAVAPFTRGYAPTEIPKRGSLRLRHARPRPDRARAARSAADARGRRRPRLGCERRVLGGGARAGSAATPGHDRDPAPGIDRADAVGDLGGPPLLRAPPAEAPLRWVPNDDFAYIDELLQRWSPEWNPGPEEAAAVKAIFRNPANLDAALGYYRALRPWPPSSHKIKIRVPTVSFAGDSDILPSSRLRARALALHRPVRGRARCPAATSCTASTRRSSTRSCCGVLERFAVA